MIGLSNKKGWIWHEYNLFDFILPKEVRPLFMASTAHDLGLCEHCDLDHFCHPIDETGRKYCTVLFHDAIKPDWKLKDLI